MGKCEGDTYVSVVTLMRRPDKETGWWLLALMCYCIIAQGKQPYGSVSDLDTSNETLCLEADKIVEAIMREFGVTYS